VLHLY